MTDRPAHSKLGASGAERWMNCPGSVALLDHLEIQDESDEPDYRAEGTGAHHFAAVCLETGQDSWEILGETAPNGVVASEDLTRAVQVFLDECRPLMEGSQRLYIEKSIEAPEIHRDYYGTVDFGSVVGEWAHIRDYKHGEGLYVEAEGNPQIIYYAYGIVRMHPEVKQVSLGIVQPRYFGEEKVRTFVMSADDVRAFVIDKIKPAMDAIQVDNDLDAGPWCRFCPAKLVCPLLNGLFEAAATMDPAKIVDYSDDALGRSYAKRAAVKFYLNALEAETFARLNRGREIPEVKLVHKKANRVWKPDAATHLQIAGLEGDIFTTPELKSPPEVEKLGGKAVALVKEWAYTPTSGLTVAGLDDRRVAVKVRSAEDAFAAGVQQLSEEGNG